MNSKYLTILPNKSFIEISKKDYEYDLLTCDRNRQYKDSKGDIDYYFLLNVNSKEDIDLCKKYLKEIKI